jgi:hypothetical protein
MLAIPRLSLAASAVRRLDFQHPGELGDDFQPRIARAFLQFAHVGAVDPGLMGEVLLRAPLGVPQPAQIGGESVPELPLGGVPARVLLPMPMEWVERILSNKPAIRF